MVFPFLTSLTNSNFMYGSSLIGTLSVSPGNGNDAFQNLFTQPLNHHYRLLKRLGQGGFGQTFLADFPSIRMNRQGKHKIFVGMATGVGKTCRMLEEAQRLTHLGRDVVIGLPEAGTVAGNQKAV